MGQKVLETMKLVRTVKLVQNRAPPREFSQPPQKVNLFNRDFEALNRLVDLEHHISDKTVDGDEAMFERGGLGGVLVFGRIRDMAQERSSWFRLGL